MVQCGLETALKILGLDDIGDCNYSPCNLTQEILDQRYQELRHAHRRDRDQLILIINAYKEVASYLDNVEHISSFIPR